MKQKIFILSLLLVALALFAGLGYVLLNLNNTDSDYSFEKEDNATSIIKDSEVAKTSVLEYSDDETGRSYFPKPTEPEPTLDVTATFNLGSGNVEPKIVEALIGQRIRLTFTASIRDQVQIDRYDLNYIFVEPQREESIAFNASQAGNFQIKLVNNKKIIGTLIIK